jgi:hypothetical protein
MWAEVRKQTGRSKYRLKIRDLFADERCSQEILDFLSATDVHEEWGDRAEEDAISEESEGELRERGVLRVYFILGQARVEGEPQRHEKAVDGNGLCVSP